MDTGNANLRELFERLSRHHLNQVPMSDDERVEAVAELLNRVRKNVFHGMKLYDDREDLKLLGLVNPVLLSVLRHSESGAV